MVEETGVQLCNLIPRSVVMDMDSMRIPPTISANQRGRDASIAVGFRRNGILSSALKQGFGQVGLTHVDNLTFLGFDRLCMFLALQCLDLYLTTAVRRGAFERSRALSLQHVQVFYRHIRVLGTGKKLSAEQLLDLEVQSTTSRVQVRKIICNNMSKFVVKAKQTTNKSLYKRIVNLRRFVHKHFEVDQPKTQKPAVTALSQPRRTARANAGKPPSKAPVPAALPSVGKRTLKGKGIGKVSRLKKPSKVRELVPEPNDHLKEHEIFADDLPALLPRGFNDPEPWKERISQVERTFLHLGLICGEYGERST